jgi:hypothetical protein
MRFIGIRGCRFWWGSMMRAREKLRFGGLIHDPIWVDSTRQRIDAARVSIKANGGNDGDAAVAGLLDRYCFGGFHQLDLVG